MLPVPVGLEATALRVVAPEETARALGNPGVESLASAFCLLYAEQLARQTVGPYLAPGEGLAGARFQMEHRLAVAPGHPVRVKIRVLASRRRFLNVAFTLTRPGDGAVVAEGEMLQALVDLSALPGT